MAKVCSRVPKVFFFLPVIFYRNSMDHWSQFDVPSPDKSVDVLTSIKRAIAAWRVIINVSHDLQNGDSVLGLVGSEGVRVSWAVAQLTPVAFYIDPVHPKVVWNKMVRSRG